ncbi:MAG: hypothetical protein WC827_01670 [Candidatus Paceibacterota bacterium]|jgi:hypothetical protein
MYKVKIFFTYLKIRILYIQKQTTNKERLKKVNERQRRVFDALQSLGGTATTEQIAKIANLDNSGTTRTLKTLLEVCRLRGKGSSTKWKIIRS